VEDANDVGERALSRTERASEYESLTQFVYQSLLDAQGFGQIKVEHDIHLPGKSGHSHQIDVYWEYELAGLAHRVAVSCKNYNSKVEISDVMAFRTVLEDIGDVKGVMVTPLGYQPGALKIAQQFGVNLYHLRPPTDEDWKGRAKTIHIQLKMYTIEVRDRQLNLDREWCKSHGLVGTKGVVSGYSTDISILDSSGQKMTDFYRIESKLPFEWVPKKGLVHEEVFEDGYLELQEGARVKLKSIVFTYDIVSRESEVIVGGNRVVRAMLGDVSLDWKAFVDDKGKVTGDLRRPRESPGA
jgi:hypothetical protein